jgi:hypothetical protein
MKIEMKEPRSKTALLQWGRALNLEPEEVGSALKLKNLVPFNPENWERMKEAVREFAENKPVAA